MADYQAKSPITLFYSYSHKDRQHRQKMEDALTTLKRRGLLHQWSDLEILPGRDIPDEIRKHIESAQIIAFLLSRDFLASDECMREWDYAASLAKDGRVLFRIPIILRTCSWQDELEGDNVKALPTDGAPVTTFSDVDAAWNDVYEGIKAVTDELLRTFAPRQQFIEEIQRTEFISQGHIRIQDIFVFPSLYCNDNEESQQSQTMPGRIINDCDGLLAIGRPLIHGEEKSGKSALARFVYLSLVERSSPVLMLESPTLGRGPRPERLLREAYGRQFYGDFDLWLGQKSKTLIVDGIGDDPGVLSMLAEIEGLFDRVVITMHSDIYHSFFSDDDRLSSFDVLKIETMSHVRQEELIRRRMSIVNSAADMSHGSIDHVEDRVNSIIVSDRIFPRYPFYILSILQTYEAYMPANMAITSYGHCYHVLIVATLSRAGISSADDTVNACFNFAEHLAFELYVDNRRATSSFQFDEFVQRYLDRFIIRRSIVNRLMHTVYGIIDQGGRFRAGYLFYFFLGRYLSRGTVEAKAALQVLCEESYMEANYLTLLFTIHHTADEMIVDEIMLRTAGTLETAEPATLDRAQTRRFAGILGAFPETILSDRSVSEERADERARRRDVLDAGQEMEGHTEASRNDETRNAIYRVLKNNRILGQVLRTKHGSMERIKIDEIVSSIAAGGLRLVSLLLDDEWEMAWLAVYTSRKHPAFDSEKVLRALQALSFRWTMVNIEQIVSGVNVPEIRQSVDSIVRREDNPPMI